VKVLFVVSTPHLSEPMGAMLLMACCRNSGHETDIAVLGRHDLCRRAAEWSPDVFAYSAMSAAVDLFREEDARLKTWLKAQNKKAFRIMGGPHPTYYPQVLDEMGLDAVCQGEGENALPLLLSRHEKGENLEGIPNIALTSAGAPIKERIHNLDAIPFAYRRPYFAALPHCRMAGLRSFYASRGCPYDCTYCFNHAYNKMFQGHGPLLRKRSVDNLIAEIEHVIRHEPPVRFIRFGDDTFAFSADAWLEEFAEKYRSRIGIPFYCLMRSNTLKEDTARLLSYAGCRSISMSIETGDAGVRNKILKRNLTDDAVIRSFELARKYHLPSFSNAMLGIPGTTLADDFKTLEFSRRLRQAAPTFSICRPYPGTELWDIAVGGGYLDPKAPIHGNYMDLSPLNSYSKSEKETQARMCYLGTLYCCAPKVVAPIILRLIRSSIPLKFCNLVGMAYMQYRTSTRIFRWAIPLSPRALISLVLDSIRFHTPRRRDENR
jgi:radical SAM superfamily enzyme YgiQ (UPF0313 family)